MKKKFTSAEIIGRKKFLLFAEKLGITDLKWSQSTDKWDVCCKNRNGENRIVEIKDRNYSSNVQFSNSGFVLEKEKYDALAAICVTKKAIESKMRPIYINFFKNGVVAWWFLDEIEPHWIWKNYYKTTVADSFVIPKYVTNLKIIPNQSFYIQELDFSIKF